jgi:hypothetical protein
MQVLRLLSARLDRPQLLHPHELSPYLRRDIGLSDDRMDLRRHRP